MITAYAYEKVMDHKSSLPMQQLWIINVHC